MKDIHACFGFFLDIKTLFRGQSRGKRPVLNLNNVLPNAKPPVSVECVQHASQRGMRAMRVNVRGMRAIHASHASPIK